MTGDGRLETGNSRQRGWPADVDVAIVAHNNLAVLPATLRALADAGCPPDRVTVVDTASTDGTGDWLTHEWPRVRVRRLDRNEGPGPGRNIGITESTRRLALIMDSDVRVTADTVPRLREAMAANPAIRIASPIVVRGDRPDVIQYAGGAIHFICEAVNPWADRSLADRGPEARDIGAAPCCALLMDRDTAKEIGLFDERYFLGKDDGDFTHRMKIAGHLMWEVPQALVLHDTGRRSDWLFYHQIRNRWHFILKNYQLRTIVALAPALAVHEVAQFAFLVAKGHGLTYVKAIGGLAAMLPALPRDRAMVRRIRRRRDRDLLVGGAIVMRADLTRGGVLRRAKTLYESALDAYWRLVRSVL